MNCERTRELFSDLHDGSLRGGLLQAAERHIRECPACEHEFKGFQAVLAGFTDWSAEPLPNDLSDRIARSLDKADWDRKRAAAGGARWLRLSAIAAVALLAGFVVVKGFFGDKAGIQANPLAIGRPVKSGIEVKMIDGDVRVQYVAESAIGITVLQGGTDYSQLPPSDAAITRRDALEPAARYDVPVRAQVEKPEIVWVRLDGEDAVTAIIFPGRLDGALPTTTLVAALQQVADRMRTVVVAKLRSAYPGRYEPAGIETLLKGTGLVARQMDGLILVR
jgi:hypothetical protein